MGVGTRSVWPLQLHHAFFRSAKTLSLCASTHPAHGQQGGCSELLAPAHRRPTAAASCQQAPPRQPKSHLLSSTHPSAAPPPAPARGTGCSQRSCARLQRAAEKRRGQPAGVLHVGRRLQAVQDTRQRQPHPSLGLGARKTSRPWGAKQCGCFHQLTVEDEPSLPSSQAVQRAAELGGRAPPAASRCTRGTVRADAIVSARFHPE